MKIQQDIIQALKENGMLSLPKIYDFCPYTNSEILTALGQLLESGTIKEIIKGKRRTSCFELE